VLFFRVSAARTECLQLERIAFQKLVRLIVIPHFHRISGAVATWRKTPAFHRHIHTPYDGFSKFG
jgi:hypothetical protein